MFDYMLLQVAPLRDVAFFNLCNVLSACFAHLQSCASATATGLAAASRGATTPDATQQGRTSMIKLNTLLGDHPVTSALKKGEIVSDSVSFAFADFNPINTGFKPMVREARFDVSEMAIVTYLMAK